MDYFEQQQLRRTESYPTAQRAADYLCDVASRLRELGFVFGVVPADNNFYEAFVMESPILHRRNGLGYPREQQYWWRRIGSAQNALPPIIDDGAAIDLLRDFTGHFGDSMFKRKPIIE